MTPLPPVRRPLLAVAGLFALTVAAFAQDAKEAKITLSLTPDGKTPTTPVVRPNGQHKLFVVIDHTADLAEKTYKVQLIGPKETTLAAPKTVTVTKGKPLALAFEPPAPKKDAPKKDEPAPKKDEEPAAPKAEPPPGFPLPATEETDGTRTFKFTVRVTNDPLKANEKPVDFPFTVVVMTPAAYIDEPEVFLTGTTRAKGISASVKATSKSPETDFVPKVPVVLAFPPQLGIRTTELRAGTYSRDLFKTGQKVELSANNLPLTRATEKVKFHLNVDGYLRAFTYTLDVNRAISSTASENRIQFDPRDTPVVRMYPVGTGKRARDISSQVSAGTLATPKYPTLPSKDLRFRVEVDRAPPNASLELKIDRTGNRTFSAPDETIPLGGPREVKVWVDPAGEGGAWTLSNTVADHVAGVDVSTLRGAHAFLAVLKIPGQPEEKWPRAEYTLLVDETPPPGEDVDFDYTKFPTRHTKGVPLEVRVWADDPESEVEKVTFYLGKPGPDGKIPEDAPKFEGVRQNVYGRGLNLWVGQIQTAGPGPGGPQGPARAGRPAQGGGRHRGRRERGRADDAAGGADRTRRPEGGDDRRDHQARRPAAGRRRGDAAGRRGEGEGRPEDDRQGRGPVHQPAPRPVPAVRRQAGREHRADREHGGDDPRSAAHEGNGDRSGSGEAAVTDFRG